MENEKLETFNLIKKSISNCIEDIKRSAIFSIACKIALLLLIAITLSLILLIIYLNPNFNLNFFYFVFGGFLAIFSFFLVFLFLNTSLDKYLILIIIVSLVTVSCSSLVFFKKIEVKPGFFYDIVTFEVGVIAFLIPLIFSIVSWTSKKYNFSYNFLIYIVGYSITLPLFFLSFLNLTFIIILQLIPNFPNLQFHFIIGFIFSSFLTTVFFVTYVGNWIMNFMANSEKVIDFLYQYAEGCFKFLNNKSLKLNDLSQQLEGIEKNKNNLADTDKIKIEKKINKIKEKIDKLRPKISEKQYGFNEAIEKIGTTLVDEIKKREIKESIIRKLGKIEDLVEEIKIFEIQCDYCYWSKEVLINQIINIYKAAVEPQNMNTYLSLNVYDYMNQIYNQLKEKLKEEKSSYGDLLLINMINKEVLKKTSKK